MNNSIKTKHNKRFLFTSRRRHTIVDCDWSSDVCSSDLVFGSVRPGWPRLQSSDPGNAAGAFNENVGVADVDRDGRAEIIGPSDVHYISAFNDDGSQIRANAMFPPTGAYWSQVGVNVDQTA